MVATCIVRPSYSDTACYSFGQPARKSGAIWTFRFLAGSGVCARKAGDNWTKREILKTFMVKIY